MQDDTELIARARTGQIDAFGELVRRYERRVGAVLYRLLDDPRDVEEATQDVFVQAWRNLARFRGDSALFTWLYRIAVNEALMRTRRRLPPIEPLREADAEGANEPDTQLGAFLSERVRALPFEYRAPLILRDIEGLSNQEVADVLGLSVAATKSRIHRARMQIRTDLEQWERG